MNACVSVLDPVIISIHAPAGGATFDTAGKNRVRQISIHAPAGGATEDGDLIHTGYDISIHAPAGGATDQMSAVLDTLIFQFTPLREGRRAGRVRRRIRIYFNSRPCGRGDWVG